VPRYPLDARSSLVEQNPEVAQENPEALSRDCEMDLSSEAAETHQDAMSALVTSIFSPMYFNFSFC